MDEPTKKALVQTIWNAEWNADIDNKLVAYFRYCKEEEMDHESDEALFFIALLKSQPEASKASLKAMVKDMQQAVTSNRPLPFALSDDNTQNAVAVKRANQLLKLQTFKIEDTAIARAVRIMLGIDTAATSSEIIGNSMVIWDDTKSMRNIVGQSLPGLRRSSTDTTSAATPFDKKKLRARHLRDYAKIEVVWTKHLPDHLELDGKTLRIFQLASLLEMSTSIVDRSKTDLSECLKQ